jgi:Holliday junction DNA helicase RuvB
MCDDMPDFEDFDDEADDDDDDFPDFDDDWDRDSSGPTETIMDKHEAAEINDVAPSSLSHLIGQRGVIDQVRVALDAAQMDGKKFDHALLVGPPGMGKSALAAVIAQEMATDFHEVLGQSIKNAADLNTLLLSAKNKDVVHIDECHELSKEYQTALYLAVDKRKLIIQNGKTPMTLPLADFTLLLSTTDEYGLLQPCRDRMKLLLRFDFYSEPELVEVLRHRSKALRWSVDEVVFTEIPKRAKGTPRLALRLLQSARRCARAEGETTITLDHFHRACGLERIDNLGLGPTETKYLQILTNGATRLNVLASMLGLPSRTVSEVTEPFLVRAGLIIKDDQGRRQLTQFGFDHCGQNARPD